MPKKNDEKIAQFLEEATITDLKAGKKLVLRWGDCGGDCMCALELVRIGKKTKKQHPGKAA